ncbi:MAG: hypothetical protein R2795_19185 [Saprospiraceae bacterium]
MNKLIKYFMFAAISFSVVGCTDLEEDLVGDITTDITVDGIPDDEGPGAVVH